MSVDAVEQSIPVPARTRVPLFLRLAVRELRNGFSGFGVFIACIALGVAAIAGIGSLAGGLQSSLLAQGQAILGGDLSVGLVHRRAAPEQQAFFRRQGVISEVASLRTMARPAAGQSVALVQLKAVDSIYPLYGTLALTTVDGEPVDAKKLHDPGTAYVEDLLLSRLGIAVGDSIRIGEGDVRVAGLISAIPDQLSGRPAFGPRVLMSVKTLESTGLVQPGSLIRWKYRMRLDQAAGDETAALKKIADDIETTFPDAGFSIRTRTDPNPNLRRGIERFAQFLTLIGVTTLLIGGLGVANAIATYLVKKREVIAAFKCLGASARLILWTYLTQILLLASIGIAAGLVIGATVPALAAWAYGDALPLEIALTPSIGALGLAALYGALTALLFALWPLGQARDVSPTVLIRQNAAGEGDRPRLPYILASIGAALGLVAVAVLSAEMMLLALYVCLGLTAILLVYLGLGWLIQRMARRMPRPKRTEFALARASLASPGGLARHVTLSLGTSLALLATVALVDHSLTTEFETGLPEESPDYFILDIGKDQIAPLEKLVREKVADARFEQAPMLRGRIVSLKGIEAEKIKASQDAAWVLNGDRGLTFADELPVSSKLVQGEWWPKDYQGPPLVSFASDIAFGLNLSVGDRVVVNVLGRNIEAKIANLRAVDWESLSINFVMVFSPNALAGAPYRLLATVVLPDGTGSQAEGQLVQKVSEAFPNVTAIRVRDAINAFKAIADQILTGIRAAGGLTLLVGAIVLAGAMATSHRRRIGDAQIFKTLGATRRRIVTAHLIEYALLGLITGAAALGLATAATYLVLTFAMDATFSFSLRAILEAIGLAMILVMGLGAFGTWRVLSTASARGLRSQ